MGKEKSCSEWQFSTPADLRLVVRRAAPQKAQMWFSEQQNTRRLKNGRIPPHYTAHQSHM